LCLTGAVLAVAAVVATGPTWIWVVTLGGFVAGLIGRSITALCVPVIATGVAALLLDLTSDFSEPFQVSPLVSALLGALFGLAGVPTALLGLLVGRRIWA